jgi:hypothetical protein
MIKGQFIVNEICQLFFYKNVKNIGLSHCNFIVNHDVASICTTHATLPFGHKPVTQSHLFTVTSYKCQFLVQVHENQSSQFNTGFG